jgi:hypothetical protein
MHVEYEWPTDNVIQFKLELRRPRENLKILVVPFRVVDADDRLIELERLEVLSRLEVDMSVNKEAIIDTEIDDRKLC